MPRSRRPETPTGEIAPPPGLHAARFELSGREVVVLSYPTDDFSLPDTLSNAEKEVTRALLCGASNAEIAKQRGVSARTTANQVASVFRKLGVSSRPQLAAKLRRSAAKAR